MAAHVICSNLVRDALKAEIVHQPVEQRGGVVSLNCGTQSPVTKLFEQVKRASETADLMNNADGVLKGRRIDLECRRP